MFGWLSQAFAAVTSVGKIVDIANGWVIQVKQAYQDTMASRASKKATDEKDTSDFDDLLGK